MYRIFVSKYSVIFSIIIVSIFTVYYKSITKWKDISFLTAKTKSNQLKTILFWNPYFFSDTYGDFGFGHEPFLKYCPVTNCYATNNRSYQDVETFDAVLFHGALLNSSPMPEKRSDNQYYAYYNSEGPIKFQTNYYNILPSDLFNLTMTYRVDSDLFVPYYRIYDTKDEYVGPKHKPNWIAPIHDEAHLSKFNDLYLKKSKPVAWVVSNCYTYFNSRKEYVFELQKYISVDIYGQCGDFKCNKEGEINNCGDILKRDYFFYLSFENSNCEDYITEKMYTPMKNEALGIVMNGVDMRRMAPPYSYIDARMYEPRKLAEYMKFLMANQMEYLKYHWWRHNYFIVGYNEYIEPICSLCEFLNMDHSNDEHKSYKDLAEWRDGSPGYKMCTDQVLYNSDYIPYDDPDTYLDVDSHSIGIVL